MFCPSIIPSCVFPTLQTVSTHSSPAACSFCFVKAALKRNTHAKHARPFMMMMMMVTSGVRCVHVHVVRSSPALSMRTPAHADPHTVRWNTHSVYSVQVYWRNVLISLKLTFARATFAAGAGAGGSEARDCGEREREGQVLMDVLLCACVRLLLFFFFLMFSLKKQLHRGSMTSSCTCEGVT